MLCLSIESGCLLLEFIDFFFLDRSPALPDLDLRQPA